MMVESLTERERRIVEVPPERAGIEVDLEGAALLTNPLLNKGTAFTDDERTTFALHGLLPPHVGTLDNQLARRLQAQPAIGGNSICRSRRIAVMT